MDCNWWEPKDQQGCNLPQLSDSKFLDRRQTWKTTTPQVFMPPHRCFKHQLQVWKQWNFLCWSVLLCLLTDGLSFAEDSQSLAVPTSHVLDFGPRARWLSFRNWTLLKKGTPWGFGFFTHELSSRMVSLFPQKRPLKPFLTHFTPAALPRSLCLAWQLFLHLPPCWHRFGGGNHHHPCKSPSLSVIPASWNELAANTSYPGSTDMLPWYFLSCHSPYPE